MKRGTPLSDRFPMLGLQYRFMMELGPANLGWEDPEVVRWEERYCELWEEREQRLRASEEFAPRAHANLNSRLHDSWHLGVTKEQHAVTFRFNDFSTHCLGDEVVRVYSLRIPHRALNFPLELCFTGVRQSTFYRVKEKGTLIPVNFDKARTSLDDLYSDDVLSFSPGSVAIAFLSATNFYLRNWTKFERIPWFLHVVEAQRLVIRESQREAFQRVFGGKHMDVFERFWDRRSKGERFNCSTVAQFFPEQDWKDREDWA